MAESTKREKPKVRYVAKKNCKQCYGRGTVLRTLPEPERRVLCGCVKEVKEPEPVTAEEGAGAEHANKED